jgi:DNA-binding NarL/FixJ family response regulator
MSLTMPDIRQQEIFLRKTTPMSIPAVKLLVVDDHPFFRQGLVEWISRQPDLTCCGEAESAPSTLEAVRKNSPDMVLLDLRLGSTDGLELIKQLRAERPDLLILVLSQNEEMMFAERALRAGANGYLMKEEGPAEIRLAIAEILQGRLFLSRRMATLLVKHHVVEERGKEKSPLQRLSDRELQVFQLLGSGLRTRQIAEELHLSIKTIETYREYIKSKLGLQNASELVRAATVWFREGQFPPQNPTN